MVLQDTWLKSGTIRENIAMARPDATEEEIIAAAKAAHAHSFIRRMPKGYYTPIGEDGGGLSEGQGQRLSIARALLFGGPVLLLDEATSALDVATERRILRNIMNSCRDKTCIVTTHRPSVLNMCQRVYRVMDTRVRELSEEESSRMVQDF